MCGIFSAWLVLVFCSLTRGHNTLNEGYALSGSSYHLCPGLDSVPVINVVAYPIASSQLRPCGGWLPWKLCNVTVYTTAYKTQEDHIQREVRRCCEGYEQVGSYCALTLNRSVEFTAKPGVCPHMHPGPSAGPVLGCEWDLDCPGWKKCCHAENSSRCVDPHTHVNVSWWLNVTVTVKVSYHLVNTSRGLFNHTRLLHSMVTGALSHPSVSVYHVTSWPAGPVSTASSMLLGSSDPPSPTETTNRLQVLLENIDEFIGVDLNDVEECFIPVLRECPPTSICSNTYGSYNCTCPPGFIDLHPSRPGTNCTTSFQVPPPIQPGTSIELSLGPMLKPNAEQTLQSTSLTSPPSATTTSSPVHTVTTNGFLYPEKSNKTLRAETRLTNMNFTDALNDVTSEEYHNLTQSIISEIINNLPPDIQELVESGKVIVQITGLFPGSVVVQFTLTFLTIRTQDIKTLAYALMESLQNSLKYSVDLNGTFIKDVDECSLGGVNCTLGAQCVNTYGSYTCVCEPGYTDANPSTPGRFCQVSNNVTTSTSIQPNETTPASPAPANHTTVTADNMPHTSTHVFNTTTVTAIPDHGSVNMTFSTSPTSLHTVLSTTTSTTLEEHVVPSFIATPAPIPINPPVISRAEAITVDCMVGSITVTVVKEFLAFHYISEDALYLGQPQCNATNKNLTHVQLSVDWNKCGVQIIGNTTLRVMLYNNRNILLPPRIAPTARLEVPVICMYSHSINVSTGYEPSGDVNMIDDPVLGSGNFKVTIRLLNGTTPLPQNYTLAPGGEITIEVAVNSNVSQIKVVINKCWANSNSNPDPLLYVFLKDSCPVVNSYTTVIQNGISSKSLLAVNVFSLVDLDIIYLHCQIQICIETASATCRPDCLAKSARTGNVIGMAKASYGPLMKAHRVTLEEVIDGTRAIGFIVLGVGLVVFFIVGIAAFTYYRKKMGNYSFQFRPRPENFTYHVFDT